MNIRPATSTTLHFSKIESTKFLDSTKEPHIIRAEVSLSYPDKRVPIKRTLCNLFGLFAKRTRINIKAFTSCDTDKNRVRVALKTGNSLMAAEEYDILIKGLNCDIKLDTSRNSEKGDGYELLKVLNRNNLDELVADNAKMLIDIVEKSYAINQINRQVNRWMTS